MIMRDKRYKMKITATQIGGYREKNINLLVNKNVKNKVMAFKGDPEVVNYLLDYTYYVKERMKYFYLSRSQYYKIREFLNVAYNTIYKYKLTIEIE